MKTNLSIIIVDDEESYSWGIQALLLKHYTDVSIIKVQSGKALLTVLEKNTPDVIYLDVGLPDIGGDKLAELIKKKFPQVKIIIITASREKDLVEKMIDLKVNAYVLKKEKRDDLLSALRQVLNGHTFYSEEINELVREIVHSDRERNNPEGKANNPTPTEDKIIMMEAAGYECEEIAAKQTRAPGTIRNHLTNIKGKGLKTRKQRLQYAIKKKLIPSVEFLLTV